MRGYIPPQDEEEKLLQRRAADMVKAVNATGQPQFSVFMNERGIELATAILNRVGQQGYCFYGGYEGAERKMLCVFEDYEPECFPVEGLKLTVPEPKRPLTHRDYLGSILGLGIDRGAVGDIVVDDTGAQVYVQQRLAAFIMEELRQVGRSAAEVSLLCGQVAPIGTAEPQRLTASVASLRLDVVLAAMLHLNRKNALELIRRDAVQVNHLAVDSPHFEVSGGDVFSVRGHGKYKLQALGGVSRKNRVFIEYLKY